MAVAALLAVILFQAEPGLEKQAAHLEPIAEQQLAAIEADLEGLPQVERVEVRLVKHAEELAADGVPEFAIGVAYPERRLVLIAARDRSGDLVAMEHTLAHELAHVALQAAVGPTPRWLTEGFAALHAPEMAPGGTRLLGAVLTRGVVPLARLEERFEPVTLAYAEAYDFVGFLAARGRWPFHNFLVELAHGASLDGAARAAFGRRFLDLEAEWLASVRERFLFLPFALGGLAFWCAGAVLLVIGWRRRRRQARATLAEWERDEVD